MARYSKFFVALIPLVTTLIVHFAGASSDVTFVWAAVVTALGALGVYVVPNGRVMGLLVLVIVVLLILVLLKALL